MMCLHFLPDHEQGPVKHEQGSAENHDIFTPF